MNTLTYRSKILFVASMLLFMCTACSDDDPEIDTVTYQIEVKPGKQSFGKYGGQTTIKVVTDAPNWTPDTKASWLKINSGDQPGEFTVTVDPFEELGSRSGDIVISGEGLETVSIPITQIDQGKLITFSEPQALFLFSGGTKRIEVECAYEWDFRYTGTWYEATREGNTLVITAQPQYDDPEFLEIDRMSIFVGDLTETTYTVAQTGDDHIFLTDLTEVLISPENESYVVEVISTLEWDYWFPDPFFYGTWLEQTERIDETHIEITAARNLGMSGRQSYVIIMDSPAQAFKILIEVHQQPDKEVTPHILAVPDEEILWGFRPQFYAFRVATINPEFTVQRGPDSSWLVVERLSEQDPYLWTIRCDMNYGDERAGTVVLSREEVEDVIITVRQSENKTPKESTFFGETLASMVGWFELSGSNADGTVHKHEARTEIVFPEAYQAEPIVKINNFFSSDYIIGTTIGEWINRSGENMLIINTSLPTGLPYTEKWVTDEQFDVWYAWTVGTGADMEILGPEVTVPWTMDRENNTFSYNATYTGSGKNNGQPMRLGAFAYSQDGRGGKPYKQLLEPIGNISFKLIRNIPID